MLESFLKEAIPGFSKILDKRNEIDAGIKTRLAEFEEQDPKAAFHAYKFNQVIVQAVALATMSGIPDDLTIFLLEENTKIVRLIGDLQDLHDQNNAISKSFEGLDR